MDCFNTILAYTNMQIKFLRNFKFKFFKNISVKFTITSISSTISICSCACQPMILPIKLVTSVFYILAKFRDFLKPVTVL